MAWALFGRIFGDDQIVDRSSKGIGAFEVYLVINRFLLYGEENKF
jgi:hypothetical protein